MKIVVTGCNGRVGRRVVLCALRLGHEVLGVDCSDLPDLEDIKQAAAHEKYKFLKVDLRDYNVTLSTLTGYEAVAQLAAYPNPGDYVWQTHNSNVVISWNVLRAAAELGIKRVAQASTVNVVTLVYSNGPKFKYFPIDEDHPCEPDEPYGLSKRIAELQADTIVRRYPEMRIASLRLHWSIPYREYATREDSSRQRNDLWGWVHQDAGAKAFLLAITNEDGKWSGHEPFFIAAPDTTQNRDTQVLRELYWAHVPLKEGKSLTGRMSFFDCTKAERLLGWRHEVPSPAN